MNEKNDPEKNHDMTESPLVSNDMPETKPASANDAQPSAETEIATLKDQLLRTLAELENARKRFQREREDAQRYAIASFAREILSVGDNLARALSAIPPDSLGMDPALKNLFEGVEATQRQLEGALAKQQIKKLEPLGEKFDSHFHQAMFEVPTNDYPNGQIVQVLQVGYMIHDRLLRPAMVAVAENTNTDSGNNHIDTKV